MNRYQIDRITLIKRGGGMCPMKPGNRQ